MQKKITCDQCHGSGKVIVNICDKCGGNIGVGIYGDKYICLPCWHEIATDEEENF